MAVATWLTFFNGVIMFAIWVPANGFGVLVFFALVSGATMGTFWMVSAFYLALRGPDRRTDLFGQTVGPLCAEIAGLKEVPSFLSLQWLTVVLPTTFAEVCHTSQ